MNERKKKDEESESKISEIKMNKPTLHITLKEKDTNKFKGCEVCYTETFFSVND